MSAGTLQSWELKEKCDVCTKFLQNVAHSNIVYMTSLKCLKGSHLNYLSTKKNHLENYLTSETSYSHFPESHNAERIFSRS